MRNRELLRLGIDGVEVVCVLNEVDLEVVAGGPSGAGRVDRGAAEGAVNKCIENLAIAGSYVLRRLLSRSNESGIRA